MGLKESDEKMLEMLKNWAKKILEKAEKEKEVYMELPIRSFSNVYYDKEDGLIKLGERMGRREFLNVAHAKKFMQTTLVASTIYDVIKEGISTSLRHVYYGVKHTIPGTKENTVDDQRETDKAIEDIETILGVVREQLHVFSKGGKGKAAGPFLIEEHVPTPDGGERVIEVDGENVGLGGWAIPPIVEPERVDIKKVEADFVLIVEKEAEFTRFHEDLFWKKHNCILITGSGQPDRATRRFVHRLHYEFGLPVYVMTDADPWGWYIYSVYKQGSINLSYLSPQLATPNSKFLGLTISDYYDFKLSKDVKLKLKEVDIKRLNEMQKYPWFKHAAWQKEFERMRKDGFKLEMESFFSKRPRYITEEYTPAKLEAKAFLP